MFLPRMLCLMIVVVFVTLNTAFGNSISDWTLYTVPATVNARSAGSAGSAGSAESTGSNPTPPCGKVGQACCVGLTCYEGAQCYLGTWHCVAAPCNGKQPQYFQLCRNCNGYKSGFELWACSLQDAKSTIQQTGLNCAVTEGPCW